MPTRTRTARPARPAVTWTRSKLLALLVAAGLLAAAAVAGLVWLAVSALHPTHPAAGPGAGAAATAGPGAGAAAGTSHAASEQTPSVTSSVSGSRDAADVLAGRPMPKVDPGAAHPGPVSLTPPGQIDLPTPTGLGAAGVPGGFPQTPAGALAQLAAIDQTAFQSGSLAAARAVLAGWAAPGGPTAQSWSLIAGLAELLDHAGLSGGGSPQLAIVLTPLMGLIKGSVGEDFVVPCVDFELDVTLAQTARGAVADCQRMTWTADRAGVGRWVIGAGPEPAAAPSVWPDTDTAIAVGYLDLRAGHA